MARSKHFPIVRQNSLLISAQATLLLLWLLVPASCQQNIATHATGYETVGKDRRRNSELAKKDNAEAIALIAGGKFEEAEKLLKTALDADVTYGPAHNNLGKTYFHGGELYLAAWEFQYASKLMPDVPEPRNNLGLVLESVGKLDEAVACYDEAVKLEGDGQFLGNDARARYRRGDRDDRLRSLLELLVLRDTRPDWSKWAREQLVIMGPGAATKP